MFRIKASYADQLELRTTLERAREFFGELRNFADLMPGIEGIRNEAGGIMRWMVRAEVPIIGAVRAGTVTEGVVELARAGVTVGVLDGVRRRLAQRVLKVAPDYVNPPPDLLARIRTEAEFMTAVYGHSASEPAWETGVQRPVADVANSSFGTRSVFNGEPRSPHAGTDFLSPAGTPIHAPAGGHVVAARELFFTGNTIVIDHGLGVFSMLAHLSRIDVREGDAVNAGDVVGLVGATGRVTGPHLHWAMRVGPARVDPLSALALLAN